MSGDARKVFAGFEKCIYCGSLGDLRDEHVVPYGMGGRHVLEAASCRSCERITSKIERRITRDLWGDARLAAGAPTRRKARKRFVTVNGKRVPIQEYPRNFPFLRMPMCGLLQGLPPDFDLSSQWLPHIISDTDRMNDYKEEFGSDFQFSYTHMPNEFGRFILKIAYCSLLTQISAKKIVKFAPSYILDPKSNPSFLVGMEEVDDSRPDDVGYWFAPFFVLLQQRGVVGARLRLLANAATPIYHAIVGEFYDRSVIEDILDANEYGHSAKRYFDTFGTKDSSLLSL